MNLVIEFVLKVVLFSVILMFLTDVFKRWTGLPTKLSLWWVWFSFPFVGLVLHWLGFFVTWESSVLYGLFAFAVVVILRSLLFESFDDE